jgi:exosortase
LLLIFSSLFYMFALLTQVHTIIFLSMLATVFGVIVYLKGFHAIKILFTPLFLFAILIPIPNQLYIQVTFPLQLFVSQISEIVIQWFGVPVFRNGNIITTPDTNFAVVEACSGLRSMIALITLSTIIGFFSLSRKVSKLVLIVASVPTAIFVNIIRIVIIISSMHFLNIDLTKGTLHTFVGLLIFCLAIFILYLLQLALEPCNKESK